MKKRKTYEISVIDKTYSKVIADETKFYTSDTALELGFELKETEYTFESAEIVLLNIDDRSLVTRPINKTSDSFVYEIEEDIIAHHGEWRGQLRFEQAGEIYVSSPVKFRIENDLSNDRPPKLSDIQSWVSLKRYADDLVDELKQAVLSAETFNANEVTRQENETVRQQAETQRVTAESSRVSAEEQRKIDHVGRSAELAGKADKVVVENLVVNGDFSDGTTGWSPIRMSLSATNNILSATNVSVMRATWGHCISSVGEIEVGHKIYTHVGMRVTNDEGILISTVFNTSSGSDVAPQLALRNPIINAWYNISGVSTAIKGDTNCNLSIRHFYSSLESAQSKVMEVKDVIVVNLTDTFGAGNEPTKEEMDELIKVTRYIDGECALNNREMLIWTLALIRRNKNAIITLGGTI